MNISQIKAKPLHIREYFSDYRISMKSVIEERWIKNWIENQQMFESPERLKRILLNEPSPTLRIRHNEAGEIKEMLISQNGKGHLCCMHYSCPDDWKRLVEIIESEVEHDG